jgi:hypothetical protein
MYVTIFAIIAAHRFEIWWRERQLVGDSCVSADTSLEAGADLVRRTVLEKHAVQEPDSGHEGRVREHLAAQPAVPLSPLRRERGAGGGRGAVGGDGPELLVAAAPRAPAGGADEDRGVGELVASAQGRGVMRRRLPDLEGHHEGGRARPGGVREAHVPHLA